MEITLPLSSLVVVALGSVGVAVSIFMGGLLLFQRDKQHISVVILASLLIMSGLTLLNDVLVTSGISNRIQQLYFIPIYYSLSIAPLFYLFIKSKFNNRLAKSDALHAIVPILQATVYLSIGFGSVEFKSDLYNEYAFRVYLQIESILFPISLLIYTIFALLLLKRNYKEHFFWSEDLRKWLIQFSGGMLCIAAMEFGFIFLDNNWSIASSEIPFYLGHTVVLSAFTFWIAINGYKQYYPLQIFKTKPRQNTSLIDSEEMYRLLQQLDILMKKDQIYLNPDLNLALLGSYLGISKKRCSHLLNSGMNTNFNQYINNLRIQAFKEKIRHGQNKTYTLTSIAYECGFDSKSTFNRVFKSSCGMTPSEYVKISQSGD